VILNLLPTINFKIPPQIYINNSLNFFIIYNIVNEIVSKIPHKFMINTTDNVINKTDDNDMNNKRDEVVDKVHFALKNSDGLTITELVKKTKLNRSAVRTTLAKLDGADKVLVRKVGMAKIYSLNLNKKKKKR